MATPIQHPIGSVLDCGTVILAYEFDECQYAKNGHIGATKSSLFADSTVVMILEHCEFTQLNIELGCYAIAQRMVFTDPHGTEFVILERKDLSTKRASYLVTCYEERFWTETILERGWVYDRTLSHEEFEELTKSFRKKSSRCPHS